MTVSHCLKNLLCMILHTPICDVESLHSLWLKNAEPFRVQLLLRWWQPTGDIWAGSFFVVGAVLCIAGCLAASLASAQNVPVVTSRVTSWLVENCSCEGSRSQPLWMSLEPWLSMETFSCPSLRTFSVHDQGLWTPAATLSPIGPASHAQSASWDTAPWTSLLPGWVSSPGAVSLVSFPFVKERGVLRTGCRTTQGSVGL